MDIPVKDLASAIASLVPNPAPEFCFLWINWWPLCMTKAEWSGWVQAVGAILAIMAGAWAVRWQVKRQSEEQARVLRNEEVRKLQIVGAALFHCRVSIATMHFLAGYVIKAEFEDLAAQLKELKGIPILEFPDWRALHGVSAAEATLVLHRDRILRFERTFRSDDHDDRVKYLNVVLVAVEFAETLCRDALNDRKSSLIPICMEIDGELITSFGSPVDDPVA